MITFTQKGNFNNTERYLRRLKSPELLAVLNKYGGMGVAALADNTPVDTEQTAAAWSYSIVARPGYYSIRWHNSNEVNGTPLAVLLQYGHGTGTGGYVQGRDYIMPAIRPIFDMIQAEAEREVNRL